jgi:hypothetical protein
MAIKSGVLVLQLIQLMQALNGANLERTEGKWYTAIPPLSQCETGLLPALGFNCSMRFF